MKFETTVQGDAKTCDNGGAVNESGKVGHPFLYVRGIGDYQFRNGALMVCRFMAVMLEIFGDEKGDKSVHVTVAQVSPVDVEVAKEDVVRADKLRGEDASMHYSMRVLF
ncbi:hypothetical protein NDU88_001972 [Pleurodeles waltl]|uniref:Uncharacterized protein n=1 Tax=Pleurodeles waltl TaxID=8319 RepID=A0AAV7MM00_PLEWA|nr:hypothetical protein NDU88_001972 [Pleurodeles waltl]